MLFHCRDAEEAETIACCEGITFAVRWPEIPMVLETDCAMVATKLKSIAQDRSAGWALVQEAQTSMEELCRLEIVKIRSQNNVAHELAQFAIRSGRS